MSHFYEGLRELFKGYQGHVINPNERIFSTVSRQINLGNLGRPFLATELQIKGFDEQTGTAFTRILVAARCKRCGKEKLLDCMNTVTSICDRCGAISLLIRGIVAGVLVVVFLKIIILVICWGLAVLAVWKVMAKKFGNKS